MPKTTRRGEPKQSELPSTIRRSGAKAQHTFAKTYDAAADQYGDEERAARTAFAALKHTHEKVGDHWEPKEEYGPSDDQAEGGAGTELAVSDSGRSRSGCRRGAARWCLSPAAALGRRARAGCRRDLLTPVRER